MTSQQEFSVVLASPRDRNALVAQINWGWARFAELNQEGGKLQLEVYPPVTGDAWNLPYEAVINALTQAARLLVGKADNSASKDSN
jgi:hypothetical protein